MTIATKKLTFAEYIVYQDGTDTRYELVDGELILMSLGIGKHGAVAKFLKRTYDDEIVQIGVAWTAQRFAIGIHSPRGNRWDTSRVPDVVVLPIAQWEALQNREAIIDLNDPPPLLVVEVVSESTKTVDYRSKRAEYSVLDIPEYWIVDRLKLVVTVCQLVEGFYDALEFQGDDLIKSLTFPNLQLTTAQALADQR